MWASLNIDRSSIHTQTTDVIHLCLSLAPLPYLSPAFSALRYMWLSIEQVQTSKRQLEALAQSIAQPLLQTLDEKYWASERLPQDMTAVPLHPYTGRLISVRIDMRPIQFLYLTVDSERLNLICHKTWVLLIWSFLHLHPTMDVIHLCLSLAPLPYLSPAFSALRYIWLSIEQVQTSKRQLEALAQSIAQLLQALDDEYRAQRLLQDKTAVPLADLCKFVGYMMP